MRTFASLLPADKPVTSTTALAVVMLDRAGVDADALRNGLTIIECPATVENDIADCIDALLFGDDAARGITWGDKNSPAMILVGHTEDREFRRALARGIPVVVVAPRERLPEDAGVQADRWLNILGDLSDWTIARTIALVTGDGVTDADVRGLADRIGVEHLLSSARPGLSSAVIIERLRDLARKADEARAKLRERIAADAAKPADAVPLAVAASDVVAKLSDLTGFGAARDWGLQLASDLRAFAENRLDWQDVDKGVLLFGGPGTGKTFFAGALAAEAGVPLVRTSYSDWHTAGSGDSVQKSLSKLFAEWRKKAANGPIIVFVDEIDSIGRRGRSEQSDYWYGPIINAWLAFLDGSVPRRGIVAIAATNRPEVVDPALMRAGRFERLIEIPRPSIDEIGGMISYSLGVDCDEELLRRAATACRGRSPATIAQLCREARRLARKRCMGVTPLVVAECANAARPPRSEALERGAAIHEAAHAVAAVSLGLGIEWVDIDVPANKIRVSEGVMTRDDVERIIMMLLAGRRADAMLGGGVDSGASDDMAKATAMARDAIARWGLTGRVHTLSPDDDAKLREIRNAVTELLETCDLRSAKLVDSHRDEIVRVAEALRERRYLDGDEIRDLVEADHAPRT